MPVHNTLTPRSKAPSNPATRLRASRAEQGLSQSDLAGLACLSRKTVQRIEGGASLSGDTTARLQWALDLPEGELAPQWDLPENPHDPGYGSKVRARRRALELTLSHVAGLTGVSVATLSRFECGLSSPRGWVLEWRDDAGSERHSIVSEPLAAALGFDDVGDLHAYCMSYDAAAWRVEGDRRSGLWLPPVATRDADLVWQHRFPTDAERTERS